MRPITRRLRLFAAILGLAQGAAPALAIAHELGVQDYLAPVAHAESLGATHDISAHSHDCGVCRNLVSKAGVPAGRGSCLDDSEGSRRGVFDGLSFASLGHDGLVSLPRAPPVG